MKTAFTLIELLVATAIAMAMAGLATSALIQVRKLILRAEASIAMNTEALSIYTNLDRQLSSLQQSCALVVTSTATTGTAGGEVRLLFMRGKEEAENYQSTQNGIVTMNTDLVWQEWDWQQTTQTVSTASSTPDRQFTPSISFTPSGATNYQNQLFENLPQPRRVLSSTAPIAADPPGLDDNLYFRNSATATGSLASPGDVGDFTDLQNQLLPCLSQVSDWSLQLVAHNGTITSIDDTATSTVVLQGVWLDGRMVPATGPNSTLTSPVAFATSPLPLRPRVLRLRFTLTDPKAVISRTFSFCFALPGLSPEQ